MKTIRIPLMVATLAALAFTTAANAQYQAVGDDGIAASPKVRQMLNERNAVANPGVAVLPAMGCPKCADVKITTVNPFAKGGQFLAGTATITAVKHTCTACTTSLTVTGEGKAKHTVATHTCTAGVPNPATCCAMN
jgi:hypothetical protein